MLNSRDKKDKVKCEIADIFMKISCENSNDDEIAEIAKQTIQEETRAKFNNYLELTTIWFQSIIGLKTSPSTGRSDNRKMAHVSLNKLLNKVNEFHDFISANELYLEFLPQIKKRYTNMILNYPEAKRILDQFKNVANRNLEKINLLESDFRLLLNHLGIFPEDHHLSDRERHKNLKIMDSLIKMIILLHKPIGSVYSRFQ
ncbi:MAG: hypothetical protein GF311_14970 [Candidatus Lokiarchaeota archaeon]|nr:hypothetical protein [Candidatus Lokiarchaeota archaeon]